MRINHIGFSSWWLVLIVLQSGCGTSQPAAGSDAPQFVVQAPALESSSKQSASKEKTPASTESKWTPPEVKKYAAGEPPRMGEDWPQFLGPRDDGISGETGLLAKWPAKGPPLVWEKRVGDGYTAPSVRGNRLVLFHRLRDQEVVQCYTADTGKPLWDHSYETSFQDPYNYSNGPRCTPLLTQDRCYTFGAEGKLLCLNLETGDKIWMRDTAADWKIPDAFFGVGSTPVLYGKLLIVMVGGKPNAGVVAFDADTGKTVWNNVDKDTWKFPDDNYQEDDKLASYSSLTVAKIHGQDFVFSLMRDGLVALNPANGAIRFNYFFRSRSFESVNAARPVIIKDEVLLSAAYQSGAALLKIKLDGKSYDELWKSRNLQTHWSTPIYHEGFAYGFSGRHRPEGRLRCIDIKTGDIAWETEGGPPENASIGGDDVEELSAQYYGRGSAIMAEGKFIILGEAGLLALVEVNSKEFKEISRFKVPRMHYPSWAAPVLSRQRLYLRCEDYMVCFDLAAKAK